MEAGVGADTELIREDHAEPINPVPMSELSQLGIAPDVGISVAFPELHPLLIDLEDQPKKRSRRKTADQILASIFSNLEEAEGQPSRRAWRSLGGLARSANVSKKRMKSFLTVIEWIQKQPRLFSANFSMDGRGIRPFFTIDREAGLGWQDREIEKVVQKFHLKFKISKGGEIDERAFARMLENGIPQISELLLFEIDREEAELNCRRS